MTGQKTQNNSTACVGLFDIITANRQRSRRLNMRLFRQLTVALLRDCLGLTTCKLGVYLVSTSRITRLNKAFLHHDGPTDVIAFDYCAKPGQTVHVALSDETAQPDIWGDVFICVDEAVRQARRFNTTWQAELVRYLVHGVLHLLGYDDQTSPTRRTMKMLEDKLLHKLAALYPLDELSRTARSKT